MVALKAAQAEAFLKSPDPKLPAVLFFGPDAGLAAERAKLLAKLLSEREQPAGEILQFEDADLEADTDRLTVELQTMPMFGGRKIIRARAGRRISTPLIKPLIEGGTLAGFLIIEAGDLRPDEGLRALFEASPRAAAIGCYGDSADALEAIAVRMLKAHGLSIAPDALDILVERLGSDRGVSRGEIEKLALYASGKSSVDADDIEAVVGDSAELRLDRVPEAAASGDSARAVIDAGRVVASGESVQSVLLAVQRYFLRLHRLRAQVDQGRSLDEAIRFVRPPVPFKLKDILSAQLRAWTMPKLNGAVADIATAIKACRQTGALDEMQMERLLLRLSIQARGKA